MIELANQAIDSLPKKVEGYRYKGEAQVELGQMNPDLMKAIECIKEGIVNLKTAIAKCTQNKAFQEEKQIEKQLLKARKAEQLKQIKQTREEKESLLERLQKTMDLYEELMAKHSKSAVQKDNPKGTYEHFNRKWRIKDPAFQELKVPDHLICPITKEMFVEPILLTCSCVFEKSVIEERKAAWEGQ